MQVIDRAGENEPFSQDATRTKAFDRGGKESDGAGTVREKWGTTFAEGKEANSNKS